MSVIRAERPQFIQVSNAPSIMDLKQAVEEHGEQVEVRGKWTQELRSVSVKYPLGWYPTRKGMAHRLIVAEALCIITGQFNLELLTQASPKANRVLFTPQMAYGPRLKLPFLSVFQALQQDLYSRRAIAHISKPTDKCGPDTPCTTALQFLVRENSITGENMLHMDATMRSWDLAFGLPVDIGVFGALGLVVARCFGVEPGNLTVHAGSLHYYYETKHLIEKHDNGKFAQVRLKIKPNEKTPLLSWKEYRDHAKLAISQCLTGNWKELLDTEFI